MTPRAWTIAAVVALAAFSPLATPSAFAAAKPAPKATARHEVSAAKAGPVSPVVVSGAWIREAPPGAHALGGYMTIANRSGKALTLTGITSPLFGLVEMHNVVSEDGRMRMQEAKRFEIPAGESLVFKPRDRHLMLMEPTKALHDGDQVPLTLHFGATTCEVSVEVKKVTH